MTESTDKLCGQIERLIGEKDEVCRALDAVIYLLDDALRELQSVHHPAAADIIRLAREARDHTSNAEFGSLDRFRHESQELMRRLRL